MRLVRALGASIILIAAMVGAPALLVHAGDPRVLLTTNWSTALLRPDDGTLLLPVLGVVGWVAWITVTWTVLAEIVAVISNRRIDVALPGTSWLRPLVGALVASALILPATAAHAAPPPDPAPEHTAVEEADVTVDEPGDLPTTRQHIVEPGDELWSVAEAHLGSGERWREILDLNPGLTPTSRLVPGSSIHLPHDVEVAPGDTLWDLAEHHLGDGDEWPTLAELNHHLIDDPDHLQIGWRLILPTMPRKQPPATERPTPASIDVEFDDNEESTPEPTPEHGEPAPMPPTPEPPASVPSEEPLDAAKINEAVDDPSNASEVTGVLGPMGGLLAGALFLGISTRRRLQLVARAIGQRLVPLSADATRFWTALGHRSSTDNVPPTAPTAVVLGWDDVGDVIHHLESTRHLSLDGDMAQSALAGIFTTLVAAPWASDVEVTLVGDTLPWAESLDEPRISQLDNSDIAIEQLTSKCATRRMEIGVQNIDVLRSEPDRAPAFAPVVYLFSQPLTATQQHQIDEALAMGDTGVSVVTLGECGASVMHLREGQAELDGKTFSPQLVEAPARRALVELFASTLESETEPAPWWTTGLPARAVGRMAEDGPLHPHLVLMGEPELQNAKGVEPQRAAERCIEYCAWLLENPGSTSTTMVRELHVAEATRRSNMSRLRKWLGSDGNGHEYLPDAYSGRLQLDGRVTSDWEEFQFLIKDGIATTPEKALREALTKVKGPLLGRLGLEWPWAASLKERMESMVVDVACELAGRSIPNAQLEQARWALELANKAAPHHDEVELRLIRVHRTLADNAYADEAVAKFRSRLRDENRELQEHQRLILIGDQELTAVNGAP